MRDKLDRRRSTKLTVPATVDCNYHCHRQAPSAARFRRAGPSATADTSHFLSRIPHSRSHRPLWQHLSPVNFDP